MVKRDGCNIVGFGNGSAPVLPNRLDTHCLLVIVVTSGKFLESLKYTHHITAHTTCHLSTATNANTVPSTELTEVNNIVKFFKLQK
jgi:hypothetical protein